MAAIGAAAAPEHRHGAKARAQRAVLGAERDRIPLVELLGLVELGVALGRRVGAQAAGSPASGSRAAFDAGYAAGANDVFGGFDGGWSLSEPYVITLARGSGAVTYRIDSRRVLR